MTSLNSDIISAHLRTKSIGRSLEFFPEIDSTNSYAKQHLNTHGAVVLADYQFAGRGRQGRSWVSPKGQSILMSVVLKPEKGHPSLQIITLAAAVVIIDVLKGTLGIRAQVKWPNDILIHGKKVCGILTESALQGDQMHKIIIGIGCNVYQTSNQFPGYLKYPVTSLSLETETPVDRHLIIAEILNQLEIMYDSLIAGERAAIIDRWRQHCFHLGKPVRVIQGENVVVGNCMNINEEGALIVEDARGKIIPVSSGEIHLEQFV